MVPQSGGHFIKISEQAGKRIGVHSQQGVSRVHGIEIHGAIIGVDHDFNTVADVVEPPVQIRGIWIAVGGGVSILNPPQLPAFVHHRVRVPVQLQEGSNRSDPLPDAAPVLYAAILGYLVAQQKIDIAHLPGIGRPAEQGTQRDAAGALVAQGTGFGVHFVQPMPNHHKRDGAFPIVHLWSGNRKIAFNRDVMDEIIGASFTRYDCVGRAHGNAVTVGVLKRPVNPILSIWRQSVSVQLSGCDQYLADTPVHPVTVRVCVQEPVV